LYSILSGAGMNFCFSFIFCHERANGKLLTSHINFHIMQGKTVSKRWKNVNDTPILLYDHLQQIIYIYINIYIYIYIYIKDQFFMVVLDIRKLWIERM